MKEIEVKILDIDPVEAEKKLLDLGAKKISDEVFEEWLFWKPEWKKVRGRVRVRVRKSKNKVFVAYKETTKSTAEGNLEIEFEVSDMEAAVEFIKKLGVPVVRHQQKRRVHFEVDGLTVDIDYWPRIPPYMEIEGKSLEKIEKLMEKLAISGRRVELDAVAIYKEIYGISLDDVTELVF